LTEIESAPNQTLADLRLNQLPSAWDAVTVMPHNHRISFCLHAGQFFAAIVVIAGVVAIVGAAPLDHRSPQNVVNRYWFPGFLGWLCLGFNRSLGRARRDRSF
jgi:hypothetical protein